jgi:uncharacterized protein (DUF924 family)
METPDTIRTFWFGSQSDDALAAQERSKLWWSKNAAADAEIRQRFESCIAMAANGELHAWLATPGGRLALILLTDQFPRNVYRDSARAFAFDPFALAWAREGVDAGLDRALRPIERVFFYLPFEHSENIGDQERAVTLFAQLLDEVPPAHRPVFEGFLDYALRHRAVIERFARFPHRNRLLGRTSSAEESDFLRQPGSSF